jgi:hypothetical protein
MYAMSMGHLLLYYIHILIIVRKDCEREGREGEREEKRKGKREKIEGRGRREIRDRKIDG